MGVHKRFGDGGEEKEEQRPLKISHSAGEEGPVSKWSRNRAQNNNGKKRKTKSVRSRIRAIERLLRNKGSELAPVTRKEKANEMEELIRLRDDHDRVEQEKEMAKKYRMVKFFERRKLERTLENIAKKGDKSDDAEKKEQIVRDLRYIAEYPKNKKYIALFPSQGHTQESRARVEAMRMEIEKKLEGGGVESQEISDKQEVPVGKPADDFFLEESD